MRLYMREEDRAMDTGNVHKNLVKIACVVPVSPSVLRRRHRQTDPQTDILITILRNLCRGRIN